MPKLRKIPGGFYDDAAHGYYGPTGDWVPSVTQVLKLTGLCDYSMINQTVLAEKAALGTLVHEITADLDKFGDYDELRATERAEPRIQAWKLFRQEKRFQPHPEWIEQPVIANIYGMLVGVTPDRFGVLDGHDTVIELKCVETPLETWGYQTVLQEMAIYKSAVVGRARRIAVQLKANGRYHVDHHRDAQKDQQRIVAALTVVYNRIELGQKVWEML